MNVPLITFCFLLFGQRPKRKNPLTCFYLILFSVEKVHILPGKTGKAEKNGTHRKEHYET